MIYLIQRAGKFYFNRRVPEDYRRLDTRDTIRFTLKTMDRKAAMRLAMAYNDKLEGYWQTLLHTGQNHSEEQYKALTSRADALGYPYMAAPVLAQQPILSLMARMQHIEKENYNEMHVEALLGKLHAPVIRLDQALNRFFEIAKDRIINKSENQIRKWKNPRKKAMTNFIRCVGNKALNELNRGDSMKFRDWWIDKIKNENLVVASGNKDLIYVKMIITTVVEDLNLNLDTRHIFKNLLLKSEDNERRRPFETTYILGTLLNSQKLEGLNEQARCSLYAFSETGAGFNELTGLLPEDIILDAEIPHIHIRPRRGRSLKTKFRTRIIPLVGFALDAFRTCPNGFTDYHDRPDSLSNLVNKYLAAQKLMPTDQHTVYSLRHSFQDRLLAVNTPDRIQADLMGHKFGRPLYGDGASLSHKLEWMKKIQLKVE